MIGQRGLLAARPGDLQAHPDPVAVMQIRFARGQVTVDGLAQPGADR